MPLELQPGAHDIEGHCAVCTKPIRGYRANTGTYYWVHWPRPSMGAGAHIAEPSESTLRKLHGDR